MELKKNESYDLERKSPLFFNIGLVAAIAGVIVAFNWKSEIEGVDIPTQVEVFDELYMIPATKFPEPPRPHAAMTLPKASTQPPVLVESELPQAITEEAFIIDADPKVPDMSEAFSALPTEEVESGPIDFVEEMPSFPGGMSAFYKYISENLKYPSSARRMDVTGKVFVQFVIDKDGSIIDVKAVKGIGSGCDEAAEMVIAGAPRWNPGKQRGREVKVRMVLPIVFKLN